ncbi:MAG: thioredoxin family protein [Armatimonadota bacterium]|nr:thioredoxin family protein [Armatimonadota bacterium]MDR5696287.1 thioredoxin family protein [Armatimonadota bacterium]
MERVWIVVAIALLVASLWLFVRLRDRRLARRLEPVDGPAVLAFTHPLCVPCRTQQAPALERLHALVPGVRIEVVDVERQPDVARRYGIFSVPTTVVVGAGGRVLAFNRGLADERKLARQLAAEPTAESGRPQRGATESLAPRG